MIEAEKANFDIVRMCDLLGVSRSGYYDWGQRQSESPAPAEERRERLTAAIVQEHADSNGVYGAPRITARLRHKGELVTRKTVAKIMRRLHLQGVSPRPFRVTTRPDDQAEPHPDRVNRVFDTGQLNQVWISDITYLSTDEGWLYLAVVRDACSRRVLGWALEEHMRAELVQAALAMAVRLRGELADKVIFHADRGSQYTSSAVAQFAADNGLLCSSGRTGVCWDNAMAESFFASLKVEFYYRRNWTNRAEAKQAVGAWMENVYNNRRLHSALGMTSPLEFELTHHTKQAAATAA